LNAKKHHTESVIRRAAKNGKADIWQLLHDTRAGDSDTPHSVFQKFPEETDTNRWLSDCHFEAVSEWALDLLLDEYKHHKADVIADFYYMISGLSDAAALRGHPVGNAGTEPLEGHSRTRVSDT
jgi:hypothetical protein